MNKLLNYTTDIAVSKTLSEIQELLVKAKASAIALEYDPDGNIKSVFFRIKRTDGNEIPFKLPAKVEEVYQRLYSDKYRQELYKDSRMEQSRRIAWRIIHTWLKAQLALLELEMVKPEEVFLPYMMVSANQTLFENMEQRGFLLPEPRER